MRHQNLLDDTSVGIYNSALDDLLNSLKDIDENEFAMFSLALIEEKVEELKRV